MKTTRIWQLIASTVTIALLASALAIPGQASNSQANGVAIARANLRVAEKLPHWRAPGAPFQMSRLRGKRVWIITSTLTVPFVADIAKGTQQAAALAGWKTTLIDGKGIVSEWNRALGEAISQKADAVISIASSPELMKGQMARAKAAHIPVIDVLTADKNSPLVPGTFAHVSISFYHSGSLQSDYAIAASGGTANALLFGDNEFPAEVTRIQGMQHEFKVLCPSCKSTFQDTQVGKLGTALGPLTQTLLRRDPSVNWVLPTYDAQALYIVPAIKQAGLATKVKVVGSDAVPSNLDWVRQKNVQVADVGEPDIWTGWAAVDEMARGMLRMPRVDENIPLRMFTANNLIGVSSSNQDKLWGASYRTQYKKLWGMGG